MLDFLPYHLLRSIYQLLEPKDLSSMMVVQSKELQFINKYRELFRKKPVLLRLKGSADHIVLYIYAAEFKRSSPRSIKVYPEEIKKLQCLPGCSIRTVVVEGAAEANTSLLADTLEKLEVFPECSVILKNVDFTGTRVESWMKFLNQLSEIPLFRVKTCSFPSAEFATHLLRDSCLLAKTFLFEDDYSSIRGASQAAGRLGDELLDDFLRGKCEKMSFSLTENITWQGVSRFIEDWKQSPREFAVVSFIRTAAFNDDVRAADVDFTRCYRSPHMTGVGLRLHLDNRLHAWISTEPL